MNTITILLHRRPELFETAMSALFDCQNIEEFDLLIFSVDGGHANSPACAFLANKCAELLASSGFVDCKVVEHSDNLGVANHPLSALTFAFDVLGSDFNIQIEDDAVPKKDLLRLALWWKDHGQEVSPESAIFTGCNHRDFGKRKQNKIPEDDPKLLAEAYHISSPFCWATTKKEWPWIKKGWNFKTQIPFGWDWSMSMLMKINQRLAVHPVLSRCQNIGRYGGQHELPETFDATQVGLLFQESEYEGDYELSVRVDRGQLGRLDDWMIAERDFLASKAS